MTRLTVILAIFFAATIDAQERAQLIGVIRDASGAAIPQTEVTLYNVDNGNRRSTRTDDHGSYAVSSLRSGNYKITVRRPGFRTIARTGVILGATDRARVDFLLEIGAVHEVITVQGAAEPVNTNDATSLVILSRDSIDKLPLNSRGIQAIPEFVPGLVITPATRGEAGQFTANGQRPNTNYFTVDGVSVNNGVSGSALPGEFSAGSLPGMTAIGSLHGLVGTLDIDEVRVQTSTFAPEFGRLPGAQVSVITRSGSNEVHGDFFGLSRPRALGAADSFSKRAGLQPLRSQLRSLGGVVSGPILRDRSFFSAATEWLDMRQAVAWRLPVPSLEMRNAAAASTRPVLDAFPLPHADITSLASEHTAQTDWPGRVLTNSFRIDHAVTQNALAFLRYNRSSSDTRAGYVQANEARFRSNAFTAGLVNSLTPAMTSEARIGVSIASVQSAWRPTGLGGAQPLDFAGLMSPAVASAHSLYALSVPGLGQFLSTDWTRSRQSSWNFVETIAVNSAAHQMRFGIDYQRLLPERERPINGVVGVYVSLPDLLQGQPPAISQIHAGAGSSVIETFSLFGQDTWRATPRLNVTYGARWEVTPPPSYREVGAQAPVLTTAPLPGNTAGPPRESTLPFGAFSDAVWKTRYTQFAPRVGAAYRLNQEGTLILRAGTGVFYDLGFSSIVDVLNGAPFNRWVVSFAAGLPSFAPSIAYGYAPDLRLPWSLHWNVAVEKLLARESTVSAAYVASKGRRLLRLEDTPATNPYGIQTVLAGNNGASDYHSLQLQVRGSLARRLRGFAAYTWSHSLDNGSWNSATFRLFPGSTDRGPSDYDARHSFQSGLLYDLPRGWTVSGVLRARTGFPIDVLTQDNPFGLAADNLRPDLVTGVPLWVNGRLNPAAFVSPAQGRQGNLGRNAIRGFGLTQLDLSVQRRFALGERASASVRVEAYNLTNTAIFADPVRFLSNPLFGQSVAHMNLFLGTGRASSGLTPALHSGGPRSLQIRLDLRF